VTKWTAYVTSDSPGDDLRKRNAVDGGSDVQLPPRSVVTLVGE
jgi:hypothetical protein